MKNFHDQVAFITGGASGIGLALAEAFVATGMRVAIADLRADHIASALERFESRGEADRVHAIRVDVTQREALRAAADETEVVFGNVQVLVNNAGVGISGPLEGISYADWDFGLGVNLGGVVNGLQTFLPRIRAGRRGGHIVNIASMQVLVPMKSTFIIYRAAKMAVLGISECLQEDLARENIGVTVAVVGMTNTNIHDIRNTHPASLPPGPIFAQLEQERTAPIDMPAKKEPEEVAAMILQGMHDDRLYVVTHGEWRPAIERLNASRLEAVPTEVDAALVAHLKGRGVI